MPGYLGPLRARMHYPSTSFLSFLFCFVVFFLIEPVILIPVTLFGHQVVLVTGTKGIRMLIYCITQLPFSHTYIETGAGAFTTKYYRVHFVTLGIFQHILTVFN